ncbi:hypothetical protein [Amnibacterium kyonggiense]|uniref:4-amino-4-deoxy-L-arabinose transferase-like glycosyltransferase n=1 Tax=Amnibacterium kyonggiense TaxID=595671 RepID=A0A4R7FT16_9MICO|nr:hypothetical protein [Amnibacterium kyonggiense]TDS81022.1 hypothetical protein CLV52_1595 [Amnibacterium kyonggiense]
MAIEAQGRRRGTSRHRSASRFAIPRPVGRAARVLTPVLSLLPPVVLLVLVQSLSPVAQRVPSGAARFDLAGAWLATEPGALAGTTSWLTAPTLGRLQLGLLVRGLQGGQAQSVLAAAHGGVLLLAVVEAVLLWWVLRRAGAGGVAAGLATAVFAIAPIAVVTHATVSATTFGACWLLLGTGLALGRTRTGRIAGGAAAAVAVASAPVLAIPAVALAALLVVRFAAERARRGGAWVRPVLAVGLGFGVAAVLLAVAMAVTAALPAGAATARLDALTAAQGSAPTLGAAAFATWIATDPLALLLVLAAAVLTAIAGRGRGPVVLLAVTLAAAVWPLGGDAVTPLVLLLPAAAAVLARSVDVGVSALGHPTFVRSVLGSAWLTGVGALLVVGITAWLVGLGGLVRGADQPVAQAERWIDSSVPAGQTVLVGLGAYPDLVGTTKATIGWYGGPAGTTDVPSSVPWSRADYVVADASLPPDRTGAAASVLGRSLEVATFGRGDAAMSVRAVRETGTATAPAAPTTAAGRRAAEVRKQAGTQLAENPRVQVDGQDRARLLAGDVDTRIVLVLAQFVTAHSVAISGFGTAQGDTSGIRTTVTIKAIDGRAVPTDGTKTGVLLRFLSDLRGDFATKSIDASDDGITAAFRPAPDLVPSG